MSSGDPLPDRPLRSFDTMCGGGKANVGRGSHGSNENLHPGVLDFSRTDCCRVKPEGHLVGCSSMRDSVVLWHALCWYIGGTLKSHDVQVEEEAGSESMAHAALHLCRRHRLHASSTDICRCGTLTLHVSAKLASDQVWGLTKDCTHAPPENISLRPLHYLQGFL